MSSITKFGNVNNTNSTDTIYQAPDVSAGGGTAVLPTGVVTSVAAVPTTINTIPVFSTDTTGTKLNKSNVTISSAGLINVPTGGSFRINNVPIPSINDAGATLSSTYSSTKIQNLNIAQDVIMTNLANYASAIINDGPSTNSNSYSSNKTDIQIAALIDDVTPAINKTYSSTETNTKIAALINDTSTGLTDVLSASKVYSLLLNSVAEYTGYQISQNNVLSSAYTVYATKQGKLITLTFPIIVTTLNATDDILSFVMPNSLFPLSDIIETCYVNDQPCKITLTPNFAIWYIKIEKNPISNFIVGLNTIKTFTISYLGINDTLLSDSVWGTAIPDFISPTVTLSIASGGLMTTIGDTRTINIVFSEPVADFIASDITLTGLTLSSFTLSGATASFVATSTANACSVIINAGVCRDAAFNLNTVSNNLDVATNDLISPSVVLSIASGGLMTGIGDTRTINIVFNEPVLNFTASDISLTGLSLSAFTFNGTTGSFVVTSTVFVCNLVINAGVCNDSSFNNNTASNNLTIKTRGLVAIGPVFNTAFVAYNSGAQGAIITNLYRTNVANKFIIIYNPYSIPGNVVYAPTVREMSYNSNTNIMISSQPGPVYSIASNTYTLTELF
jgi:hypothetical protein